MHIKLTNGQPEAYSIPRLLKDHPNISFTLPISEARLAEFDVYPLTQGTRPAADVVQPGPIEQINGVWTQTYTGRAFTQAEIDANLQAKRSGMKVSMRQARLALQQASLLASVEAAIASMDEPTKTAVSIEWEYAHVVDRLSPWMTGMATALGMTDEDMDNLFEAAAQL